VPVAIFAAGFNLAMMCDLLILRVLDAVPFVDTLNINAI